MFIIWSLTDHFLLLCKSLLSNLFQLLTVLIGASFAINFLEVTLLRL